MTLTQGHGCGFDKQKFACLHDKLRTTQRITTDHGSCIPLVMLKTWLDFEGILLETDFFANFLWKVWMCFFKVKHSLYWTYLRNGWYDWCETKRSCIGWILGELCDLDHWPHPWPWPLIFQGQILKDLYLRNCYLIDVKQKESKSIRYRGDCMVLPFDHTHELDLVISRSKFEVALFEEWEGWLTWNKRDVSWSFMTMTLTYG